MLNNKLCEVTIMDMKQKEKLNKILGLVFKIGGAAIALAYFILLIIGSFVFEPTNEFWYSLNIFSGAGQPNQIIRVISYAIFVFAISWIVRFLLKQLSKILIKGNAIIDILCSLIKYASVIVLLFFVLQAFGVDTTAIITGLSIVTLIIGLALQPLLQDVIAGLFIVFEHVFEVGDIVVIGGFRGTVKEIGIRTTRIEDAGGNVKVINNSELRALVNMSDELSIAACDIGIEYGESLERVEAILKEHLDEIKKAIPEIVEGPFYKGVSELADSSVNLKFVAKCKEGAKYQVERDMNRQFKLLFDKHNVNIPFPQVVLNQPVSFENASAKDVSKAKEFVQEQKDLSSHIRDEDSEVK